MKLLKNKKLDFFLDSIKNKVLILYDLLKTTTIILNELKMN